MNSVGYMLCRTCFQQMTDATHCSWSKMFSIWLQMLISMQEAGKVRKFRCANGGNVLLIGHLSQPAISKSVADWGKVILEYMT